MSILNELIKKNGSTLFFIIITIIGYSYYIINGGFGSGDDYGFLFEIKNKKNFFDAYINEINRSGQLERPVSVFFRVLMFRFFKDNYYLYNLTNILTWISSIYLISLTLKKIFNKNISKIFLLIGSFPFFASSLFFAQNLISTYSMSILLWSISLLFLIKFTEKKLKIDFYFALIFLSLSVFTLEYLLPLLIISIFFPLINDLRLNKHKLVNKNFLTSIYLYIIPTGAICIIFLVFKLFLVKNIFPDDPTYGFNKININSFLQAFYFFFVLIVELPILLIKSLSHIIDIKTIPLIIFLFLFLKFLKLKNIQKKINNQYDKYFLIIIFISLLSCPIIFLLSYYPATSFGYYNKMMLPSFIICSIIFSYIINYLNYSKKIYVSFCIIFLWIFSAMIQIENTAKSNLLRTIIIHDIVKKINKINNPENFILIANVPFFLNKNFNNEPVFMTKWHLTNHIRNLTNHNIKSWPICYRTITNNNFYPAHNLMNSINEIDDTNFLYYEYDIKNKKSNFEIIDNKNNLINKIESARKRKLNSGKKIFREKIRDYFKSKF